MEGAPKPPEDLPIERAKAEGKEKYSELIPWTEDKAELMKMIAVNGVENAETRALMEAWLIKRENERKLENTARAEVIYNMELFELYKAADDFYGGVEALHDALRNADGAEGCEDLKVIIQAKLDEIIDAHDALE
jgi:hypothetical protein